MKKFLLKIGLFFLALIIFDRTLGMVFAYMGEHAKGGYVGHHVYVTDKANEDILIFGSSRAIHHYNPQIISDSLDMTCYNCGQDGNGIILFYGLWQMIKERHRPKMIIYDVSTGFDLYEGDNNQRYLGWLRMDYDRPGIKPIFIAVDPTEEYKMISMLYRYNSKFMQVLTDYFHPIFRITGNGFLPYKGKMDTMKVKSPSSHQAKKNVDSLKIKFINKLIDETEKRDVILVFAVSPSWYETKDDAYRPIMDICKDRNLSFYIFDGNFAFTRNNEYFKDGNHLNATGADEFSKIFVSMMKKKIHNENTCSDK